MTQRAVLLQALASTPADIERLIRGLDESNAARQTDASAWSPGALIGHLLAVEHAYQGHIRRIIEENEPLLTAFPPPAEHQPGVSVATAAERFRQSREATLSILRGLSAGDWQRKAMHETRGRISLRTLVQRLVEHDIEHTNQLVEIRQTWRNSRAAAVISTTTEDGGRLP
ncbi:protein of unknown function [Candidatus Promineifilum breve]|uniref:DinB-like domain-containing protein n=1 Tax=Candidatus Promineifilum breve TaxID=1806508 RepID=A0A160SZP4_9CHLR|nr:DinB family protein [Candidatus Promineifilum breve]CUS02199.2 protein of unknown function [Candidatus Promineifilum breve]